MVIFSSGIQFYLLLRPYLCFVSFIYLDLYVLGDDALISEVLLCKPNIYVSWSTSELRVRLASWNWFKSSSKIFYWPFQCDTFTFCGSFMLFLSCVWFAFMRVCLLMPCGHCWERLTSWLSFVMSSCEFVTFPLVSWVRCGPSLYRLLIFALFLTLKKCTFTIAVL